MSFTLSSFCARCRHSVLESTLEQRLWKTYTDATQRRWRSSTSALKNKFKTFKPNPDDYGVYGEASAAGSKLDTAVPQSYQRRVGATTATTQGFSRYRRSFQPPVKLPVIDPNNIPAFFKSKVLKWTANPVTTNRLRDFGILPEEIPKVLKAYSDAVLTGTFDTPENFDLHGLKRLGQPLESNTVDIVYSTVMFSWIAELPPDQLHLVPADALAKMRRISQMAGRRYISEEHAAARRIRRKVIMHVGPTNSGKTHHALRALAGAPVGVYAGPLRLLAHEVWERLNLGQIVPAGKDPNMKPTVPAAPDILPSAIGDLASSTAQKNFNPLFARTCNMITGEEQKIVNEQSGLVSCTVEMLSLTTSHDVAVIDEIQMISDEQRGFAWTSAVLGVRARELHLCGEETAVPIVQELLKDTGDEVIIKRYERLTTLTVEEKSLENDLTNVRKGDCIVTFSRSGIFRYKRLVEEKTGMRCALVYGKLPPEIRSEQAALFNDSDSGYDVLIGSDAIGMGLNL